MASLSLAHRKPQAATLTSALARQDTNNNSVTHSTVASEQVNPETTSGLIALKMHDSHRRHQHQSQQHMLCETSKPKASQPTSKQEAPTEAASTKPAPRKPSRVVKLALDACLLLVKACLALYDLLTLPYFYIKHDVRGGRLRLAKLRAKEAPKVSKTRADDGTEVPVWRSATPDARQRQLERHIDEFESLGEMMRASFKQNAAFDCYGYRELLAEQFVPKLNVAMSADSAGPTAKLDPSKLQRQVRLAPYRWVSFAQFELQVEAAARGLLLEGVKAGDKVMLYAETRAEWQITLQALFRLKAVVCTMYATLGAEAIVHSMNETRAQLVVAQADKVERLLKLKQRLPHLKKIVYVEPRVRLLAELGGAGASLLECEADLAPDAPPLAPNSSFKLPTNGQSVRCVCFNRVLARGATRAGGTETGSGALIDQLAAENAAVAVTKDSLAVLMYTSGSTGQPKGVCISHRNIMATVKSFSYVTRDLVRNPHDNVGSAYLPLAHIFEFCIELMMIFHGVKFGFCTPHTLTDQSPGLVPGEKGDLVLLRPSVVIMVPLVLDRVAAGVKAALAAKGYFAQHLIKHLVRYKQRWAARGFKTPLVDRLVCRKVAAALGGSVSFVISGSAPLSSDTQSFVRSAFNMHVLQGFGTTETCSATSCQTFDDDGNGNVGPPVAGCSLRLDAWPEAGYSPFDSPNPRGEILVGGENVALGYYKLDELSREAFFVDARGERWYRTGDIGEMTKRGQLKIIDRKKDLVKLQNGEYVSLGKIESTLKTNAYTDNFCIFVNSNFNYVVALAPANYSGVMALARRLLAEHDAQVEPTLLIVDPTNTSTSTTNTNTGNQSSLPNNSIGNISSISSNCVDEPSDESEDISQLRAAIDAKPETQLELICKCKLVNRHILDELSQVARENGLLSLEIPKKLVLIAEEWTEDSNLVTAAMKIRRNFIYKRYERELQALYDEKSC